VLGGGHDEVLDAEDGLIEAGMFAGVSLGTSARQSSGRKPMTKFTPPVVVRGSRMAEMVERNC